LFIFVFLSIFFFTYASTVEGKVVEDQVTFMLDSLFGIHLDTLEPDMRTIIFNKINSIEVNSPENIKATNEIKASNDKIIANTTKILGILSGVVLGIVGLTFILSKKNVKYFRAFKFSKILKESFVIILFVALTEFCFLTYLGSKFVSVNPNKIKAQLFENLKNSVP